MATRLLCPTSLNLYHWLQALLCWSQAGGSHEFPRLCPLTPAEGGGVGKLGGGGDGGGGGVCVLEWEAKSLVGTRLGLMEANAESSNSVDFRWT